MVLLKILELEFFQDKLLLARQTQFGWDAFSNFSHLHLPPWQTTLNENSSVIVRQWSFFCFFVFLPRYIYKDKQ